MAKADDSWILSQPLEEMLHRLIAVHHQNTHEIPGSMLGLLAQRLVKSERQVGGPYSDGDTSNDPRINYLIQQLFLLLGSSLPNVDAYVAAHPPHVVLGLIDTQPTHKKRLSKRTSPEALAVKKDILHLPLILQKTALTTWKSVAKADRTHEISRLSHDYYHSIERAPLPDKDTLKTLGIANFYAWMAYTIYDDFIDSESHPPFLPVANVAHRKAVSLYDQSIQNDITEAAFTTMDTANAWELAYCRFIVKDGFIVVGDIPNYKECQILADRSLAHVLGPLLLNNKDEPALRSYLIARQLNDDLHDWTEDLQRGHISYVVAYLLNGRHITAGTYAIDDLTSELKEYFWQSGLQDIATLTENNIQSSIDTISCAHDSIFTQHILEPILRSAQQSKRKHQDQHGFLESYSQHF